ncbi:MAG: hypothetical protein N3A72_09060 [bacterium]|nr:hypothetical protein [bacterium]
MKVCKKCKATLINNKWIPTKNLRKRVTYTLCPTCAKETKEVGNSVVLLDAKFFKQNEKASMQLLHEVEKRIRSTNFYSRILLVNPKQNPILIKTSHPSLAIQIGKQFHKTFHGKLIISQNGQKGVLVRWINSFVPQTQEMKPSHQPTPA